MNGAQVHQILDVVTGDSVSALKAAGYSAIDTGRDVRMPVGGGIRRADAVFDVNKKGSSNIFHSFSSPVIPSSDQHQE